MRISDWSSDVCSSDLPLQRQARHAAAGCAGPRPEHWRRDERHHRDARQAAAGHWPGMDRPVLRGTPERRPGTNGLCPVAGHRLSVPRGALRSEEHTSELQSLMRISYAVFCLKKKKKPLYRPVEEYQTKNKH